MHQSTARRDQAQAFLQREYPRNARGGVLADAMTKQQIGGHAPLFVNLCERVFERKQGGLRKFRLVQRFTRPENVQKRTLEMGCEQGRATVHPQAKGRVGFVQRLAHADVLGALPGKQECQFGGAATYASD